MLMPAVVIIPKIRHVQNSVRTGHLWKGVWLYLNELTFSLMNV